MPRKKKIKNKAELQKNTKTNINDELDTGEPKKVSTTQNNISYEGTIKVKIQHNGKIIKTKQYHNTGTIYLFEYLCKSILGTASANECPYYIKLFNRTDESTTNATIDSKSIAVSPLLAYNVGNIEVDNDISASTTLHFTIPCTQLSKTNNNIVKIYQAALYGAKYADDKTKYSTIFNFLAEGHKTWEPIVLNVTNDYNIYIEWTLTFMNAN